MTKTVLVLSVVAGAITALDLGGLRFGAVVQLIATSALYLGTTFACRNLMRFSNHKAMRNLWLTAGIGLFVRSLADFGQAAATIIGFNLEHPELQTSASKAIYALGLLITVKAFIFYPLAAESGRERSRLFLDLCTIMIVVAGFGWFGILAPRLDGSASAKEIAIAAIQFSLLLIYTNFFRLILNNTDLLTKRSKLLGVAAVVALGVSEVLVPELSGTRHAHWIFVARIVAVAFELFTLQNQSCSQENDATEQIRRKKPKAFNISPYLAVGGLYVLLIVSLVREASMSLRIWGLLIAAVLTLAVVVVRQLSAFVDNARLVQRLDDNLQQLQESYDREQQSNKVRSELEIKLRHAQKLEALGRIAGGVAHEINTPVQYVTNNVEFLRDSFARLSAVVDGYAEGRAVEAPEEVEFLKAEVPASIEEVAGGLQRIATIVRSLQSFGGDETDKGIGLCDVSSSLADTLVMLRHDLDRVPEVAIHRGDGDAFVQGSARDLGQVWFALIHNAIQAVEESGTTQGEISICVSNVDERVVVEIADNGVGIPPEAIDRVFDPFFTTRDVGAGKGQGLAIARTIVVEGHGGALTFTSEEGVGTTFRVELPAAHRSQQVVGPHVGAPHGETTMARWA